jgi:hypothetical protein
MTNPIIGQEAPTPLYELFEKFPDIPRTIIIKLDVLNWGVRYTPILNWIGKWTLPHGIMAGYESKPEEIKRGEISCSTEEGGFFDIPSFMVFRDGTNVQVLLKEDTPYEIRYEGDGTYMLYWRDMAVEEVRFVPRPAWLSKKLKDGTPLGHILLTMGDTHT